MNPKYTYNNAAQGKSMKVFNPLWWRCWWITKEPHEYNAPYVLQYKRSFRGGGLYILQGHVDSEPTAGPFKSLRLALVALELLS